MKKDDASKKRKLPTIDHGIDIVGDEWDEEINTNSLQNEENWENEGGVTLPHVDDNTPREELDAWTVKYHRKITRLKTAAKEDNWKERYEGYREWKKKIPMKELARLEEEYNMKGNDE